MNPRIVEMEARKWASARQRDSSGSRTSRSDSSFKEQIEKHVEEIKRKAEREMEEKLKQKEKEHAQFMVDVDAVMCEQEAMLKRLQNELKASESEREMIENDKRKIEEENQDLLEKNERLIRQVEGLKEEIEVLLKQNIGVGKENTKSKRGLEEEWEQRNKRGCEPAQSFEKNWSSGLSGKAFEGGRREQKGKFLLMNELSKRNMGLSQQVSRLQSQVSDMSALIKAKDSLIRALESQNEKNKYNSNESVRDRSRSTRATRTNQHQDERGSPGVSPFTSLVSSGENNNKTKSNNSLTNNEVQEEETVAMLMKMATRTSKQLSQNALNPLSICHYDPQSSFSSNSRSKDMRTLNNEPQTKNEHPRTQDQTLTSPSSINSSSKIKGLAASMLQESNALIFNKEEVQEQLRKQLELVEEKQNEIERLKSTVQEKNETIESLSKMIEKMKLQMFNSGSSAAEMQAQAEKMKIQREIEYSKLNQNVTGLIGAIGGRFQREKPGENQMKEESEEMKEMIWKLESLLKQKDDEIDEKNREIGEMWEEAKIWEAKLQENQNKCSSFIEIQRGDSRSKDSEHSSIGNIGGNSDFCKNAGTNGMSKVIEVLEEELNNEKQALVNEREAKNYYYEQLMRLQLTQQKTRGVIKIHFIFSKNSSKLRRMIQKWKDNCKNQPIVKNPNCSSSHSFIFFGNGQERKGRSLASSFKAEKTKHGSIREKSNGAETGRNKSSLLQALTKMEDALSLKKVRDNQN